MSSDDDLPIFRPKFGRGVRPRSALAFPSFRSSVLAKVSRQGRIKGVSAARMRVLVHAPAGQSRRVVVKAHVQRMGAGSAKAAALHVRYIVRNGVEKDGSPGVLYGPDGPASAADFEAPRLYEKHQFRLIVSPEDAHELDLTAYVRGLMAQVARDAGRRLEWAAVNHFDTDHPHAHVLIRGVDLDRREVRLDRAYISNGLRWRAQELATEELGPRPQYDLARQREREIGHDRFTSIDRDIERRAVDNRIEVRRGRGGGRDESLVIGRLEHLRDLGLAEKLSGTSWALAPSWQTHLRDLGMRHDKIKQMHRALKGDASRYRILDRGAPLETDATSATTMYGRVASKGLVDELRGSVCAIVETPSGGGLWIPLDRHAAENVREGDWVAVSTIRQSRSRREDEIIERMASAQRRVVDINKVESISGHSFDLAGSLKKRHDSGVVEGAEKREPLETCRRRLQELEKLGFASPVGDGKWNVKAGFVDELAALDRSAPRHRLRIEPFGLRLNEQVAHKGPVWLDRIEPAGLAPYGLGAELHPYLAKRHEVLRANGIEPMDERRHVILHELERRGLGDRIARENGGTILERIPEGFRGLVKVHEGAAGSGVAYAEVRDGSRFVLVPANRELRAASGRRVSLSFDEDNRLRARRLDRDRGLS